MLSSASLNALSLSQATSGYSEEVDLEVIDEIIEKAPREATTFPLVYKSYLEVLQEQNISAQDDTIYYQFLLKLGVIRARSWGERWDLWRATHGSPASLPFVHRPNLPSRSSPPHRPHNLVSASTPTPGATRAAQVKAKLPFLASASSDLDEGFLPSASARSSHSRDADAETETVASEWAVGNGEQGGVRMRPSPRKRLQAMVNQAGDVRRSGSRENSRAQNSRSQGSVSPKGTDAQLDKVTTYSDRDFASPRAQHGRESYRHTVQTPAPGHYTTTKAIAKAYSPTPPPYTPSDISTSLIDIQHPQNDLDLTADDLAIIDNLDSPATPRATSQHLPSRRLVDVASVSSARHTTKDLDTEAEEEHMYHQESVREMVRRAEEFYRTGLMGRCWDTWVQSFEWIKHTTVQIDSIRSSILLRQALHKWSAHHTTVLHQPNTADAHRRAYLQRKALQKWSEHLKMQTLERRLEQWTEGRDAVRSQATWLRWKGMLGRKVQGRYRAELGRREEMFVVERDKALVRDCAARWRGELRTRQDARLADAFFSARIVARWRYRAEQERRLLGQITVWESTRRRRTTEETLYFWHQAALLHQIEGVVGDKREDRLTRVAFREWASRVKREKQGREMDARRILRNALAGWKTEHRRLKVIDRQAALLQKQNDSRLLQQAFGIWTTQERGNLLDRVRNQRQLKSVLTHWKASLDSVRDLECRAASFRADLDLRLKGSALSRLSSALARRRELSQRAVRMDESRIAIHSMKSWRKRKMHMKEDAKHADAARAFFVQHTTLKVWKVELGRRRQERWVRNRDEAMKRDILLSWRDETLRALEGRARADGFRQQSDRALLSKCLLCLTNRFIALKSRELSTTAERNADLKRTALVQWARRGRAITDKQRLAQSFADLRTEGQLRDALLIWRERARAKRERRRVLEELLQRKKLEGMREFWDVWRDRIMEGRLSSIEQEVALRREDALLFRIWDTWKANTMTLPAISFNKRRILRLAWERLMAAKEDAVAIKSFSEPKDVKFLAKVFVEWKLRARAKTVARVGRVRGRIRPSHNNSASPDASHSLAHPSPQSRLPIGRAPPAAFGVKTPSPAHLPAYTRLRSELSSSRLSISQTTDGISDADERNEGIEASSHLVRALRTLSPR